MKRWWSLIFFAFAIGTVAEACNFDSPNGEDWVEYLFGCKQEETCVIVNSKGGVAHEHRWAAQQALERNTRVVVDGPCSSSCVIFTSIVRKNVCITEKAEMGVHAGFSKVVYGPDGKAVDTCTEEGRAHFLHPPEGYREEGTYVSIDYGEDINRWAKELGKMPESRDVYVMTHDEALLFWEPCHD